jgi:hypothetical protein
METLIAELSRSSWTPRGGSPSYDIDAMVAFLSLALSLSLSREGEREREREREIREQYVQPGCPCGPIHYLESDSHSFYRRGGGKQVLIGNWYYKGELKRVNTC